MEQKVTWIPATCPDCRGPLKEIRYDGMVEFECLVGHRFSVESLLATHSEAEEKALWAAIVALEEAESMVHAASRLLPPDVVQRLEALAAHKREQAVMIRRITEDLEPFRTK